MLELFFDNWFSGYVTVVAGVILLTGIAIFVRSVHIRAAGCRAEGIVVRHVARLRSDQSERTSFMAIVRFSFEGRPFEFQTRSGGSTARYPVGARLPVIHLPHAPEQALLFTWFELWFVPLCVMLFGAALLFVAVRV